MNILIDLFNSHLEGCNDINSINRGRILRGPLASPTNEHDGVSGCEAEAIKVRVSERQRECG